jgi:hypothetical protein
MINLSHLAEKEVVFKIPAVNKAMSGKVTRVEDKGLWIIGREIALALSQSGFPVGLQEPALFVPFHSLEWLMAASES